MEPKKSRGPRREKDDAFLMAYACGATVEIAAARAGYSKRTGQRRLQNPECQKRLQEIRAETFRRSLAALTAATPEAIKNLLDLMKASVSASVRLGACRTIIELGVRLREHSELTERLLALEEKHRAQESGNS